MTNPCLTKTQVLKLPYHWRDIRKYQVSTINKQRNTLSTVFQDDKSYVQEKLLKVSKPWTPNVTLKWHSESPSPLLKLVLYVTASQNCFFFFDF